MNKILYIKANVKPSEQSRTYKISDYFIEEYQKKHQEDKIEQLDLYQERIDFLRMQDLETLFGTKTEESRNHSVLKYAYQFAEADKYIIAAPMWNLSIPAILKAYIDYISVVGITFRYTKEGSEGLLIGKKAVFITTRGGIYQDSPLEMGERYIKTVLGFFGIKNLDSIAAEGLDIMGADIDSIIKEAQSKADQIIEQF